jgi:uncharacterized surface protein with fasciclin (FAS1) repeats
MKLHLRTYLFALTGCLAMACGDTDKQKNARELGNIETAENLDIEIPDRIDEENISISAVMQADSRFDTLNLALERAGLHSTLNEDLEYTAFAPTDKAFKSLPDGKFEELIRKGNETELIGLLTYHLVSGNHSISDIREGIAQNNGTYTLETLQGSRITFTSEDDEVYITDVDGKRLSISEADVEASNGIIHAIDQVAMHK